MLDVRRSPCAVGCALDVIWPRFVTDGLSVCCSQASGQSLARCWAPTSAFRGLVCSTCTVCAAVSSVQLMSYASAPFCGAIAPSGSCWSWGRSRHRSLLGTLALLSSLCDLWQPHLHLLSLAVCSADLSSPFGSLVGLLATSADRSFICCPPPHWVVRS